MCVCIPLFIEGNSLIKWVGWTIFCKLVIHIKVFSSLPWLASFTVIVHVALVGLNHPQPLLYPPKIWLLDSAATPPSCASLWTAVISLFTMSSPAFVTSITAVSVATAPSQNWCSQARHPTAFVVSSGNVDFSSESNFGDMMWSQSATPEHPPPAFCSLRSSSLSFDFLSELSTLPAWTQCSRRRTSFSSLCQVICFNKSVFDVVGLLGIMLA